MPALYRLLDEITEAPTPPAVLTQHAQAFLQQVAAISNQIAMSQMKLFLERYRVQF